MTAEKRIRMIRLLDKMARNEEYTRKLKLENVSAWKMYRKGDLLKMVMWLPAFFVVRLAVHD